MEESIEKSLKSLNEKFNFETALDSADMEKSLREFTTELYIKREQVKTLRNDLENATSEITDLKKALDTSTKALDEKSFNLNILSKKNRNTEDELFEKINALNTIQLQHNLTVSEVKKLKECLQINEGEKLELSRKVEIFETKERQSFIYHNQILKRETSIRKDIEGVEEMMKKLENEQRQMWELSKKIKIAEESNEKMQQLSLNYEKIKKERDYFEELYTKINAKYEMMEELLQPSQLLQDPNLPTKVIFNQWKSNRKHYEEQINEISDILNNLSDCYNNEKLANIKLIEKNEQLTEYNQKLQIKYDNQSKELEQLSEKHKEIEDLKEKIFMLEEKLNNENKSDVAVKDKSIVMVD